MSPTDSAQRTSWRGHTHACDHRRGSRRIARQAPQLQPWPPGCMTAAAGATSAMSGGMPRASSAAWILVLLGRRCCQAMPRADAAGALAHTCPPVNATAKQGRTCMQLLESKQQADQICRSQYPMHVS